jgi:hypothetical protein
MLRIKVIRHQCQKHLYAGTGASRMVAPAAINSATRRSAAPSTVAGRAVATRGSGR